MNSSHPHVSEYKSKKGLKRIFAALRTAIVGLKSAWITEHAFRQEVAVIVPAILIALMLPVSAFQKLVLIGVLVFVLIVELLNSSLEAVVDRISLEFNPLSKNAKDFGSAAVLLSLLLAAATWTVIILPLFGF